MLIAENIRVFTYSRDSLTVAWQLRETVNDPALYTVTVMRSDSEVGPYEAVSEAMNANDVSEFEDRGVNLFSKWREHYYRVRFTKGADTWDWGLTPPDEVLRGRNALGAVMETVPDIEALEAIHRFDLNLREFIGNKMLLMKRRRWGRRCPDCWDSTKGRAWKSGCENCFDTTWAGGYWTPQETFWMNVPRKVSHQLTSLLKIEVDDKLVWMNARPRILPEDVLIDVTGNRWRALPVDRSEKLGMVTRQTIQMRRLSRDQVEYRIPLRGWDVDSLTVGPHRQYIRANDIDEYHVEAKRRGLEGQEPNQVRHFFSDIDEVAK